MDMKTKRKRHNLTLSPEALAQAEQAIQQAGLMRRTLGNSASPTRSPTSSGEHLYRCIDEVIAEAQLPEAWPSTSESALGVHVHRIERRAAGHEEPVAVGAAEAEVRTALGQVDAADVLAIRVEDRHAVEPLLPHAPAAPRSEEHTSELQSRPHLVCRLLLEKKKPNMSLSVTITEKTSSMHN